MMMNVTTQHGKQIEIVSVHDLRDPRGSGTYVRAFCHIHGSDHQRSLSINRVNGWGHCFNAACQVTVLVAEWNPRVASRLTTFDGGELTVLPGSSHSHTGQETPSGSGFYQRLLLPPEPEVPQWQRTELDMLNRLENHLHQALATTERAKLYLHGRGVPLELARATGISYLPAPLLARLHSHGRRTVWRWGERIIFPLVSPTGRGYIGRSLHGWRVGMDENQHKTWLDAREGQRRWIKTNPAGWFSTPFDQLANHIVLVEGGFDRLALLQAGWRPQEVVALVGTSANIDWLPLYAPQVRGVLLALDNDEGGHEAARKLAVQCVQAGLTVEICPASPNRSQSHKSSKDWSELWRQSGRDGLRALFNAYHTLRWHVRSA